MMFPGLMNMDQDMEEERMRQEMLLYYIDGNIYNRDHDRQFLESLARMGYLEWSHTNKYECYF